MALEPASGFGPAPLPSPVRLTEFAPAAQPSDEARSEPVAQPVQYGPPRWAHRSWTSGFAGSDFVPQPDGSLRCPAGHPLTMQERRPERNGSLRVVYGARMVHCRPCPLRSQCQEASTTKKPRQVSAMFWPVEPFASSSPPVEPLASPQALCPVLWGDWPRSHLHRNFIRTLHRPTVELTFRPLQPEKTLPTAPDLVQTRAQRAHYRLSWQQRLARNARSTATSSLEITIDGLPASLAAYVQCRFVTAA
jgi:hypothetical protein